VEKNMCKMAAEVEGLFTLSLLDKEQAGLKGSFFLLPGYLVISICLPIFFLAVDIRERMPLTGVL